jgi:Putative Ig domain
MVKQIQAKITSQRKRLVPVLVALSLLSGLVVSLVATPNAVADYNIGCGYGYNSTGSVGGTGTGIQYGYGYLANNAFGYGYGNEVCPLAVTTATLPAGTVGTSYSQALAGTGGAGTYVWTESGALPAGITLSTAGTLSGTPTASGAFPFTVTMTDANAQIKTATLSLTVAAKAKTPPKFHAIRVAGYAVVGRTVQMVIVGVGFYGDPRVTSSDRGATVRVTHDHGNILVVRITTSFRSPRGWHTLTIRLANGDTSRVNYLVK